MKVGAARVDITPPLGMTMEGFDVRTAGAAGIHDPLHARALVAESADGTTVALVVADLIQVDPHLQELVAAEIRERIGIPRERIQLAGTHTHSGPMLREPSEAEAAIGRGIADAVARAWEGRRDAVAAVGIGEVTGIGANRRPGGGPVDDRVTVTRFDDLDGKPIATHVNYGCHPTTLGPNNYLYSADYPGVLCRLVDEAVGGVTIFSTGPAGRRQPGRLLARGEHGRCRRPVADVRVGGALRTPARRLRRRDPRLPRPGPIRPGLGRFPPRGLARKRLPDPEVARRAATVARASATTVVEAGLTPDATYHALVAAAYAELLADQAAAGDRDEPVRIRASALAIGPLLHVGVSGELFVALGQRIRRALGDDRTCIAALCDGTVGYIPTAEAFAEGAYEPNASLLMPGEGERLAEAVVNLALAAPAG